MALLAHSNSADSPKWDRAVAVSKAWWDRTSQGLNVTLARIKPNVLTVAGFGCIDVGAFSANHIAGWVATGLSILALDWKMDG